MATEPAQKKNISMSMSIPGICFDRTVVLIAAVCTAQCWCRPCWNPRCQTSSGGPEVRGKQAMR